jgi:hypothetical protein
VIHGCAIQILLALACEPGADDPHPALLRLGVYDDYEPAVDWADRDESVLGLGMVLVKDLQILSTRFEELARL